MKAKEIKQKISQLSQKRKVFIIVSSMVVLLLFIGLFFRTNDVPNKLAESNDKTK